MRKIVLPLIVLGTLAFLACSSDDDANSNCESCTSDEGIRNEICNNGDGTYAVTTSSGGTVTITEGELEGLTPKEVVELACAIDIELEF